MKVMMIERNEKGQFARGSKSPKKGLTYEQIYGSKRAERIKQKSSDSHKGQTSPMKGKTHSKEIRERIKQNTLRCWNDGTYLRDRKQIDKWEQLSCKCCGESFESQKWAERKYCSPECYHDDVDRKGSNAPNWRGGISPEINIRVGSKFWKDLAKTVRERDKYTCQTCSKQQWNLDVHHIIPERLGGPHEDWNLISLCKSCHMKITIKSGGVHL